MPPPPMPTAPAKKFNGKVIGGLVLVLVALIFAGVALVSAWWTVKTPSIAGDVTQNYNLNGWCASASGMNVCGSYGNTTFMGVPIDLTNIGNTMMIGMLLTVLGLVMAILTLILILVGAGKPKMGKGVLLIGIIGAIVLVIAVFYVFAALPGAADKDMGGTGDVSGFFGSKDTTTWGGGIGWYMALIGFIMLLIGSLVAASGMKAPPPYAATPMA